VNRFPQMEQTCFFIDRSESFELKVVIRWDGGPLVLALAGWCGLGFWPICAAPGGGGGGNVCGGYGCCTRSCGGGNGVTNEWWCCSDAIDGSELPVVDGVLELAAAAAAAAAADDALGCSGDGAGLEFGCGRICGISCCCGGCWCSETSGRLIRAWGCPYCCCCCCCGCCGCCCWGGGKEKDARRWFSSSETSL
jgi:hypothetical protein